MSERPIIAQCLEYPIGAFGGVEVLVRQLIEGLAEKFRIVLVSNDEAGAVAGSPISALIKEHIPWSPQAGSAHRSKELAGRLKKSGVQLAHFHFGGNYAWGNRTLNRCPVIHVRQAGIPVLSTNHGVFELLDGYCAPYRPRWMKLGLLPFAWVAKMQSLLPLHTEIAVSRNDLRNLLRWYWPLRHKFRQIYHSKLDREEPSSPTRNRKKTILCVGTIGHRKGQVVLTKAFAKIATRHPEWGLLLAGRNGAPDLYGQILQIREQSALTDRIIMDETLSDASIADLMRTSAIFAMPSFAEGLGLSLQEALFRGCACVGSRAGGIPELIEDGRTGRLVPAGDVVALADALEELIADENLRERFGTAARLSILSKEMTAQQMVKNYAGIYNSILASNP